MYSYWGKKKTFLKRVLAKNPKSDSYCPKLAHSRTDPLDFVGPGLCFTSFLEKGWKPAQSNSHTGEKESGRFPKENRAIVARDDGLSKQNNKCSLWHSGQTHPVHKHLLKTLCLPCWVLPLVLTFTNSETWACFPLLEPPSLCFSNQHISRSGT